MPWHWHVVDAHQGMVIGEKKLHGMPIDAKMRLRLEKYFWHSTKKCSFREFRIRRNPSKSSKAGHADPPQLSTPPRSGAATEGPCAPHGSSQSTVTRVPDVHPLRVQAQDVLLACMKRRFLQAWLMVGDWKLQSHVQTTS
jgi:hypothetical protein